MDPYKNRDYFDYRGNCEAHEDYHCARCRAQAMEEAIPDGEIVEVISSTAISVYEPKVQDGLKNYRKQLSFIQKVKKFSDSRIAKVKIKDIEKLLKECQEECTVGDFNAYIEDEELNTGFWKTLFGKK